MSLRLDRRLSGNYLSAQARFSGRQTVAPVPGVPTDAGVPGGRFLPAGVRLGLRPWGGDARLGFAQPHNRPSPLQRAKDRPLVPKVKPHLITIPPHLLDPKRPISPTLIADHFPEIATLYVVARTRRMHWAARSGMIRAARFSGPKLCWPRERNSTRLTPLTPPTPRTALTSNSRRL